MILITPKNFYDSELIYAITKGYACPKGYGVPYIGGLRAKIFIYRSLRTLMINSLCLLKFWSVPTFLLGSQLK